METTNIKELFNQIQSEQDLVDVLNIVSKTIFNEKAFVFTIEQLRYHSNAKLNKRRYIKFSIPKKSGGSRTIHSPNNTLKQIQICLNFLLGEVYKPSRHAFGFVTDKSIVDNAKVHVAKNYVYNIDLKDFFPSIDQARIWKRLQFPPFNLIGDKIKCANMIAGIACHTLEVERKNELDEWTRVEKNVLPQGSPLSPTITNIVCERLDFKLSNLAKSFGAKYSRYADDITFSSDHSIYGKNSQFLQKLEAIIASQNFHIKESKTRLQKREGYRQEVTGLIVNDKVNITSRYIKTLRLWLYRWEKEGYDSAYRKFLDQYINDKGHVKSTKPNMANVIHGKLLYLKMVIGENNASYKKLRTRFDALSRGDNTSGLLEYQIQSVIKLWESHGIEKAMEEYSKMQSNKDVKSKGATHMVGDIFDDFELPEVTVDFSEEDKERAQFGGYTIKELDTLMGNIDTNDYNETGNEIIE
jgi:RNA-directed DNA polymerase